TEPINPRAHRPPPTRLQRSSRQTAEDSAKHREPQNYDHRPVDPYVRAQRRSLDCLSDRVTGILRNVAAQRQWSQQFPNVAFGHEPLLITLDRFECETRARLLPPLIFPNEHFESLCGRLPGKLAVMDGLVITAGS